MAYIEISPAFDDFLTELARFGDDEPEIAKKVVIAGAQPVADEIRKKLESLPQEKFRRLGKDEVFTGVPWEQKRDLLNSLGIAPAGVDGKGNTNTKVGFKDYGSRPTKKYPKGVPNALLARAIESGSTVRKKTPFVRPATDRSEAKAIEAMEAELQKNIEIYAL